jgi:cell division protein FtsL
LGAIWKKLFIQIHNYASTKQMKPMSQETPVQKKINIKFLSLAVICIILAASLVGVSAVYLSNQGQLSEKDSTIASLNDDISALQLQLSQIPNSTSTYLAQIAYLNQQLDDANASYTSINAAYSNLLQIVQMRSSGVMYEGPFIQEANTTTILYNNPVDYAGVVVIQTTANSTSTYAQVMYTFGNYNFDYNQTLGTSGTAAFPILPGDVLLVIGNLDGTDINAVNATATYYF